LDRLAQAGALFERCYANATICTPARASLMTGKPVPGHGVYRLHDILPDNEVMLPKRLQSQGYETALVGKLHVSGLWHEEEVRHPNDGFEHYDWCIDPGLNFDSRFNTYARWVEKRDPRFYEQLKREGKGMRHFPAELHFSTWAAETTIARIESRDRARPFFINTSFFDPHDPYFDYPAEVANRVNRGAISLPQGAPDDSAQPDGARREFAKSQAMLRSAPDYQDDARAMRVGYHAKIALLDEQIGRILECLDREGLAENTLVVFVSDHGDMLFDRGLFAKGGFFYDASVRVPLLVRWPGRIAEGTRVAQLVQLTDITATLLAAAGFDRPQLDDIEPHSMDLVELARRGDRYDRLRDWAVSVYRNSGFGPGGTYYDPPIHATMFHDGRYKLNVYHKMSGSPRPEGELYDMREDPLETRNLWRSPTHADVKSTLLQRMMNWTVDHDVRAWGSRGGERFRPSVSKDYR
jgi:arylsulfatase